MNVYSEVNPIDLTQLNVKDCSLNDVIEHSVDPTEAFIFINKSLWLIVEIPTIFCPLLNMVFKNIYPVACLHLSLINTLNTLRGA